MIKDAPYYLYMPIITYLKKFMKINLYIEIVTLPQLNQWRISFHEKNRRKLLSTSASVCYFIIFVQEMMHDAESLVIDGYRDV
jgi:hypothetical protein